MTRMAPSWSVLHLVANIGTETCLLLCVASTLISALVLAAVTAGFLCVHIPDEDVRVTVEDVDGLGVQQVLLQLRTVRDLHCKT